MSNPDVHDDRTAEQASKEARADGVERMLSGQDRRMSRRSTIPILPARSGAPARSARA
jgi:hypothetical protein